MRIGSLISKVWGEEGSLSESDSTRKVRMVQGCIVLRGS